MPRLIKQPIHIIGYPRSGTTLLGRIVARHEGLRYVSEPRFVWTIGHNYRSHERLDAGDYSSRLAEKIDRTLARYISDAEGKRLIEKTPSNGLRIPYIRAIYPDGKLIHLVRDGRAVVRSQYQRENSPKLKYLKKRVKHIPLSQWPSHVPLLFRTVVRPILLGREVSWWGPRPPGWRRLLGMPPHRRIAHQWNMCMEIELEDVQALDADVYLEVRYEDLLRDCDHVVSRIFEFLSLPPSAAVEEYIRSEVEPERKRWTSIFSAEQEAEIEHIIQPALRKLGY